MSDMSNIPQNSDRQHWIDRATPPSFGIAPNGRSYRIEGDERYLALHAVFLADACQHEKPVVLKRINSAGNTFFTRFCPDCGLKMSSHIKRDDALREGVSGVSEAYVDEAQANYLDHRKAWLDKLVLEAAERAWHDELDGSAEWRLRYGEYLQSAEWKRKAAKVKERDGNVCQGCLSREAEEVHHTSYDHVELVDGKIVGSEFAFELMSLCSPCHRRFHGKAD